MAEWQTQRTQNPPIERSCGFESHLGHPTPHAGRWRQSELSAVESLIIEQLPAALAGSMKLVSIEL